RDGNRQARAPCEAWLHEERCKRRLSNSASRAPVSAQEFHSHRAPPSGQPVSSARARRLLTRESAEVAAEERAPARARDGMCFDSAKLLAASRSPARQKDDGGSEHRHDSACFARTAAQARSFD